MKDEIPQEERTALIALYNATNGDNWKNNDGWKAEPLYTDGFAMPGTENKWYGVYVKSNTVLAISLRNNHLKGEISPEIGTLINLEDLDIYSNKVSGKIPPEIGKLIKLEYFIISNNQLTGEIPPEIGELINLNEFDFSENQLTEKTIPKKERSAPVVLCDTTDRHENIPLKDIILKDKDEHFTDNIRNLKKNRSLSFGISSPADTTGRSVCEIWIQAVTPSDEYKIRPAKLIVNFIDEYRDHTIYNGHEIEMTFGIHWMKVMCAFPQLLNMFSNINGVTVTILDFCSLLADAGFDWVGSRDISKYEYQNSRNKTEQKNNGF